MGLIHLWFWLRGYREVPVIGTLFMERNLRHCTGCGESLQTPLVPTPLIVEASGVLMLTLTAMLGVVRKAPQCTNADAPPQAQ